MGFPASIIKAIESHVEVPKHIRLMAAAANADLYYGDTSSEDYPGFVVACRILREWLYDECRTTLYVDEDSGCVSTREPDGEWVDGDDSEDDGARYVEPMPYYVVETADIAKILFGSELASSL